MTEGQVRGGLGSCLIGREGTFLRSQVRWTRLVVGQVAAHGIIVHLTPVLLALGLRVLLGPQAGGRKDVIDGAPVAALPAARIGSVILGALLP